MATELSDDALERTLYGPKLALTVARPGPDLVWMHTELRRPGVTLEQSFRGHRTPWDGMSPKTRWPNPRLSVADR